MSEAIPSETSLFGQVGIVTGAGRGIGRAVSRGLAARGMAVAVQARTRSQVEDTAALIAAEGGSALPVVGDVTDVDDVRELVRTTSGLLGPVDLLVNNAGSMEARETPLWLADPAEWWHVIEVNLRGPMLMCAAVLPGMIERGRGRVVNMNSLSATRTAPGYSAYAASKAGLMRLTDAVDAAVRDTGLAVFDVSPGLVQTSMTAAMAGWQSAATPRWTPVSRVVALVAAIAAGEADVLSGRFLHALDDLRSLVADAERVQAADGRKLRLRRHAPEDPIPTWDGQSVIAPPPVAR